MEIPHTTRVNSMPSDKKQGSVSLPALHAAVTKEELLLLNKAAKKAALSGNRELTEEYRKKGVSLDIIGRAVGLSGNWDYAEYLLEQNPQSLTLATELAIGFRMIKDSTSVNKLKLLGANMAIVLSETDSFLPKHVPAVVKLTGGVSKNTPTPQVTTEKRKTPDSVIISPASNTPSSQARKDEISEKITKTKTSLPEIKHVQARPNTFFKPKKNQVLDDSSNDSFKLDSD